MCDRTMNEAMKARERSRERMIDLVDTTVEKHLETLEDRFTGIENTITAISNYISDVEEESCGAHSYEFTTAHHELVSLAEIAQDVCRDNPVVEVVLKGAQYKEFHHLLIHVGLISKMLYIINNKEKFRFSSDEMVFMALVELVHSRTIMLLEDVCVINVTSSEPVISFSLIMASLNWARSLPLKKIAGAPQRIVVRSR